MQNLGVIISLDENCGDLVGEAVQVGPDLDRLEPEVIVDYDSTHHLLGVLAGSESMSPSSGESPIVVTLCSSPRSLAERLIA